MSRSSRRFIKWFLCHVLASTTIVRKVYRRQSALLYERSLNDSNVGVLVCLITVALQQSAGGVRNVKMITRHSDFSREPGALLRDMSGLNGLSVSPSQTWKKQEGLNQIWTDELLGGWSWWDLARSLLLDAAAVVICLHQLTTSHS